MNRGVRSRSRPTRHQLDRFERRGATAVRRNRHAVERQAKDVRDSVEARERRPAER